MGYYSGDNSDMVSKGLHAPKPGLNSVGEYQVAGRPFVKSIAAASFESDATIESDGTITKLAAGNAAKEIIVAFPFVTSRLKITNNSDDPIAVYFCSLTVADAAPNAANSGVKANRTYFVLPAPSPQTPLPTLDLKIKCRKVYVAGYGTTPTTGTVNIAAELTNIEESYNCDVDNIVGISG